MVFRYEEDVIHLKGAFEANLKGEKVSCVSYSIFLGGLRSAGRVVMSHDFKIVSVFEFLLQIK